MSRRRIADRFAYPNANMPYAPQIDWGEIGIQVETDYKANTLSYTPDCSSSCPLLLEILEARGPDILQSMMGAARTIKAQCPADMLDCLVAAVRVHLINWEITSRLACAILQEPKERWRKTLSAIEDIQSTFELPQSGFLRLTVNWDDSLARGQIYMANPVHVIQAALGRQTDRPAMSYSAN